MRVAVPSRRYCDRCGARLGKREGFTFHLTPADLWLFRAKEPADLCQPCGDELGRFIGNGVAVTKAIDADRAAGLLPAEEGA